MITAAIISNVTLILLSIGYHVALERQITSSHEFHSQEEVILESWHPHAKIYDNKQWPLGSHHGPVNDLQDSSILLFCMFSDSESEGIEPCPCLSVTSQRCEASVLILFSILLSARELPKGPPDLGQIWYITRDYQVMCNVPYVFRLIFCKKCFGMKPSIAYSTNIKVTWALPK